MTLNDKTINERRIETVIDHDELSTILVNYIAKQAGFTQTGRTKTEVRFDQELRDGKGMQTKARVTLVNDIN